MYIKQALFCPMLLKGRNIFSLSPRKDLREKPPRTQSCPKPLSPLPGSNRPVFWFQSIDCWADGELAEGRNKDAPCSTEYNRHTSEAEKAWLRPGSERREQKGGGSRSQELLPPPSGGGEVLMKSLPGL